MTAEATVEVNGGVPREWPYRFQVVEIRHMIVDAYQRPLSSFVERIEHNYQPALIGTLCLSERTKTKFALIDGQTRAEGMKRVGEKEAPCIVYENLTLQQEAELFARFQTERRGMTSAARFKAEVIARHEHAVAINEVLEARGFVADPNLKDPNAIRAVAALEFVYFGTSGRRAQRDGRQHSGVSNTDPELLGDTLDVIKEAWPNLPDTAKSATMIKGVGWFLARGPDNKSRTSELDIDRLISRLGKITPSDLAKRADALKEGRGMQGHSPAYMAEAIEAQYRKKG